MRKNQSGHFHIILALVVIVIVAGGAGWYVYQKNKPSKLTSPALKSQLKQTSSELKQIDLAKVKQTADTVSSVQTNFNYKKANGVK